MPYRKNKEKRERTEKQVEHDRKLAVLRSTANSSMRKNTRNIPDMDINPNGKRRVSNDT